VRGRKERGSEEERGRRGSEGGEGEREGVRRRMERKEGER
jgi:hypothetical protein